MGVTMGGGYGGGMMGGGGSAGGAEGAMGALGAVGMVTILKYVLLTLVIGLALGLIGGFVYASFKYPNPNKKALFTPKQRIIMMAVALVGVAMIIFAFVKKPKSNDNMMVNGGDISMSAGVDENGSSLPEGEPADGAENGTESSAETDSGEASSSEASSEASTTTGGTTDAGGATGGVVIGGGGIAVMPRVG